MSECNLESVLDFRTSVSVAVYGVHSSQSWIIRMVDQLLAFRILFSDYAIFEPLIVRLEMNGEI